MFEFIQDSAERIYRGLQLLIQYTYQYICKFQNVGFRVRGLSTEF